MNERNKEALIKEMAEEREELLVEVSLTNFLTDLVREKAREFAAYNKQYGTYRGKEKTILFITCLEKKENFYPIKIDTKDFELLDNEVKEMKDAISLIEESGYRVKKNFASKTSVENFLMSYEIKM